MLFCKKIGEHQRELSVTANTRPLLCPVKERRQARRSISGGSQRAGFDRLIKCNTSSFMVLHTSSKQSSAMDNFQMAGKYRAGVVPQSSTQLTADRYESILAAPGGQELLSYANKPGAQITLTIKDIGLLGRLHYICAKTLRTIKAMLLLSQYR